MRYAMAHLDVLVPRTRPQAINVFSGNSAVAMRSHGLTRDKVVALLARVAEAERRARTLQKPRSNELDFVNLVRSVVRDTEFPVLDSDLSVASDTSQLEHKSTPPPAAADSTGQDSDSSDDDLLVVDIRRNAQSALSISVSLQAMCIYVIPPCVQSLLLFFLNPATGSHPTRSPSAQHEQKRGLPTPSKSGPLYASPRRHRSKARKGNMDFRLTTRQTTFLMAEQVIQLYAWVTLLCVKAALCVLPCAVFPQGHSWDFVIL